MWNSRSASGTTSARGPCSVPAVCSMCALPASPHKAAANAAAAATAVAAAAQRRDSSRRLMLSLERSVGNHAGRDAQLRATNAFHAEVFPDLPIATTWANLWQAISQPGRRKQEPPLALSGAADVDQGVLKVRSVAANLRTMSAIRSRMIDMCVSPPAGAGSGRPADALLLVSGSHPARLLPGTRQLLPSGLSMLQLASQMRHAGDLPPATQLWAVANPSVESDASLAERKVAAGAQVLLTQPPFDPDAYAGWLDDARRRGVLDGARLLVGHAMVSSSSNLAFWLDLSQCAGRPACRQLLAQFRAVEAAQDQARIDSFCAEYNARLTAQALDWQGVAGFHIMPITPRSKQATLAALRPGGMMQWDAPQQ